MGDAMVDVGVDAMVDAMVVEELHFVVDPGEQPEFLRVEHDVWTRFLETCDGFVTKQTWIPDDDPERVVVVIWWNSLRQWKRVTPEQCDEVDARMGGWLRPVAHSRTYRVVRPT